MKQSFFLQYNYLKYKNNHQYKSKEEIETHQLKSSQKLMTTKTKPSKLLYNIKHEHQVWLGMLLARILPNTKDPQNIAFFSDAYKKHEALQMSKVTLDYYDFGLPMFDNIGRLSKKQPTILIAPPSILMNLADAIYNKRLTLKLTKVISVAEVLEDRDKTYFMEQFGVNVIHQLYQSQDRLIGYTCDYGTLHLNEDIFMVEKEVLDKGRFMPIVTSIIKGIQPISKLLIQDILVEKKEACLCGSPFMALERIEGRVDDIFIVKNQLGQNIQIYPEIIRQAIFNVEGIKTYEVIQHNETTIQINLAYDARNMIGLSQDKLIQHNLKEEFSKITKLFNLDICSLEFDKYHDQSDIKVNKIRRGDLLKK